MARRIIDNGEPGMINLYNIQKFGRYGKPMADKANLINPCFSGETLIATADGRGYVYLLNNLPMRVKTYLYILWMRLLEK